MHQHPSHSIVNSTKEATVSSWLTGVAVLLYLVLLGALVFLPQESLLDRLRWLDSGICAQIPSHSFYPGGERLPLCSRNTGIYLGFIVSLLTLYALRQGRTQRIPPWPITTILICGMVILVIDGSNSFALDIGLPHLYQPHNLIRLATGLLTGLALAAFTLPILNRLFWSAYNEQRCISSGKILVVFLPILLVCFFAVASQNPFILYPIALLSTTGLLTVVASVNLIVLIMANKRYETFERYRQLLPFLALALILAIGELLALAQFKLTLLHVLGALAHS